MPTDADHHFYEPRHGHRLPHDPFNAIVAPRPIGWVSTRSRDGVVNLAPYSFFNAFAYTPPIIGFASTSRKDSVANAEATGEFCWNLVTEDLAEAMNATSAIVAPDIDEMRLAGLTPTPGRVVDVPYVAESPVAFECRTSQVIRLTAADGTPAESWLTLGEVVGIHIAHDLLVDGIYDTARARPLLRGGGPTAYFGIRPEHRLDMRRPS
ncbi:flavin reductase family protein [Mumia sp. DW29H23]|uniref:flavin reductase family protein n=1 Tax=Mumia sp. DW29H23 TaxID=3421241 RepID=UPI003D6801C5